MSQKDAPRTKAGELKHTCNGGAGPHFGRKTPGCGRCDELLAGAPARGLGWDPSKTGKALDAQICREIAAHFKSDKHLSGGCGPVCTYGEW